MKQANWITCTNGCGGDMQFKQAPEPQYLCADCGHEQTGAAFSVGEDNGWGEDGVIDQLGLYDDLLNCLAPGEPWLEYGIIEYRYRARFSAKFRALVKERGHRNFPVGHLTASKLIGQATGILAERGRLVKHVGGAGTGFWSYNDPSHWYALPPAPPLVKLAAWSDYLDGAVDGLHLDESIVMSESAIRAAIL
jgi:hypothetical protein